MMNPVANLVRFSVHLTLTILMTGSAMMPGKALAYEKAFEKTPVGSIEIKTLPPSKALVTRGQGNYFERQDALFMRLFSYIRDNDVSMTVPVEAEVEEASMKFYVGAKDASKTLDPTDQVTLVAMPERTVLSVGARGAYNEKNFKKAKKALEAWLETNQGFRAVGKPYAVYWNGPYLPFFLKRSEVHIPVEATDDH